MGGNKVLAGNISLKITSSASTTSMVQLQSPKRLSILELDGTAMGLITSRPGCCAHGLLKHHGLSELRMGIHSNAQTFSGALVMAHSILGLDGSCYAHGRSNSIFLPSFSTGDLVLHSLTQVSACHSHRRSVQTVHLDIDAIQTLELNPSDPLQHAGHYYHMAARCAEARRERFLASDTSQPPGYEYANEQRVVHLMIRVRLIGLWGYATCDRQRHSLLLREHHMVIQRSPSKLHAASEVDNVSFFAYPHRTQYLSSL
ncbi:hypothetical protein JVU11DRAFT_8064 [Chiua virens]|nr:hypothetical protein JVU11DRAFT_8064 [Chiua virens]